MGLGIMQGRLLPPAGDRIQQFPWRDWPLEFALAGQAGLDAIEWIYEEDAALGPNPLSTDEGIRQIRLLCERHAVRVSSVCADYFMDHPLLRAAPSAVEERLDRLKWLMDRAALMGAQHIVLPFVDASHISTPEEADAVASALRAVLPRAEATGVEVHLETSLPPHRVAELLDAVPHPLVKLNYDSGNSASLGFHPDVEFACYGGRVGSVHIKDRVRGGGSVPLGTGNADFEALFAALDRSVYRGGITLQAARGRAGEEVAWSRENAAFVTRRWKRQAG